MTHDEQMKLREELKDGMDITAAVAISLLDALAAAEAKVVKAREALGRNAYYRHAIDKKWKHIPWDELHPDTRKLHTDHACRAVIEAAEKP